MAAPASAFTATRTNYVMGTMLTVSAEAADSADAAHALDTAFAATSRLDRLLSNYRPESELSQAGTQAPEPVSVSASTFDFLSRTLAWSVRSDGALDPTVGPLVQAWGFNTEHPARPPTAILESLGQYCDYRRVLMDPIKQTVQLPAGFSLDPGATGKGYALAVVDSLFLKAGIHSWNADFGGQLYCRGADTLLIPVRHPRSDTAVLAWLAFAQGSVATSGDYERFFELDGVRYAHIFDPRTQMPVQGRAAVTVYAPDPFAADALSTAAFVLGPAASEPLLASAGAGALFAEWKDDSLALIIVGEWPAAP